MDTVSHLYHFADESYYKNNVKFGRAIPFFNSRFKWKDVKGVHCTLLLMNTGLKVKVKVSLFVTYSYTGHN